jgi:hypothetical protein
MAEIEKIAVYDARIIQDPPKYAVQKGALSVSTSSFQANAANASQLSFQVLVPSLNVFTDRKIELNSSAYVYAEAVPSQLIYNAPAQTLPYAIPAGQYIDQITDQLGSYRQQDTPTCPSFSPSGSQNDGGNTALVLQDNAWPGLVSVKGRSLQETGNDITPSTTSIPPTQVPSGANTSTAVWDLAQLNVPPPPPTVITLPSFANPFAKFAPATATGTFQVDYNIQGIFNGINGWSQAYLQFQFDLVDPLAPTVSFASFFANVTPWTTNNGTVPALPFITSGTCIGTASVELNNSAIITPANLTWKMTGINGGWSLLGTGTFTAALQGNSFPGQAGPGVVVTLRGFELNSGIEGPYLNWYQSVGAPTDLTLGMFPVQSLATSMTVSINDCSVSVQGDVLREQLLISQTRDSLMQRTCPSKFDMYAWTQDDAKTINGVTAGFDGARDSDIPNGSYPLRFVHPTTGALLNQFDAYTVTLASGASITVPVINWAPAFIPYNSNLIGQVIPSSSISGGYTIQATNAIVPLPVMYRFQTTEPLCISPFLWQDSKQMTEVGLYGITNMTVTMTLGNPGAIQGYSTRSASTPIPVGSVGRLYMDKLDNAYGSYQYMTRQSGINALYGSVRLQPPTQNLGNQTGPWVSPPRLLCTFLTPPPEITLPLVSSVPYVEFPRYNSTASATWSSSGTVTVSSNTVTLSSIPDLLVVWARPAFRGQTQSDTYIPISNIGVTFDNYANLCSNYSQEDLYACSVAGGLDMDWNQFRGYARERFSTQTPVSSGVLGGLYDTYTGYSPYVQLTGAPIVLRMGQDIPLSSGLAPGTLGNYSVQVNVTLDNSNGFFNYLQGLSQANNVIITIMGVNSGFFESVRGSSAIRKTILNTNDVEAASTSSSVTSSQLVRLVGGASGMHTSSRLTTSLGMPQFKPAVGDEPRMRKMARMSGSMIPQ